LEDKNRLLYFYVKHALQKQARELR
jgi:hypothetical protein